MSSSLSVGGSIESSNKTFNMSATCSNRMGYINIPDSLEYHKYYKNNYRLLLPFIITFIQYLFYDRWFARDKLSIVIITITCSLMCIFYLFIIIWATILYPNGCMCKYNKLMNDFPNPQPLQTTSILVKTPTRQEFPNLDNNDEQNQESNFTRAKTMATIEDNDNIECKCLSKLSVYLQYIYENSTRFINQLFNPGYIKLDINKKQEYQLLRLLLPDSEKKHFMFALCVTCYASIVFIIANILLFNFQYSRYCLILFNGDKDGSSVDKQDHWDGCLFKYSSFSPHYSLVAVLILFIYYRKANTACHISIVNQKNQIIDFCTETNKNYKNNKNNNNVFSVNVAKYVDNNIVASLMYWKQHKFLWGYDRILFIILFIFCIAGQITVSHFRNDLFNSEKFGIEYKCISILLCFFDGLIASTIILLEIRLCRHFQFPSVIMESLSLSIKNHLDKHYWCKGLWNDKDSMYIPEFLEMRIKQESIQIQGQYDDNDNAESVEECKLGDNGDDNNNGINEDMFCNDLKAWWKLRKFYIHDVIFHMSCTFEQAISVTIGLSITLGFVSLYQIIFAKAQVLAYFIIFWTIIVMLFAFLFCTNAVKYLSSQQKHLLLLKEIKLQLRSKKVSENIMNFIDDIENEISNDLVAMKAFGLSIDSNFMSAVNVIITGFISTVLVESLL